MPLDIALSNNTPTATLELRQAQPLGDARHHAAFLVVRSGAFAAALPFVFARDALAAFGESLDSLLATRLGTAALRASTSDDVIRFDAADRGNLGISGDLHEIEGTQRLTFSFGAEWEGLAAFIDGIHGLQARDVN